MNNYMYALLKCTGGPVDNSSTGKSIVRNLFIYFLIKINSKNKNSTRWTK